MSDVMPVSDLLLACSFWMQQQIEALIPGINNKISAMYSAEANPALVDLAVTMGELTNASAPTICVWAENGSQPIPLEMHGIDPDSQIFLLYKIRLALPTVGGGNTVSDFELTKLCATGKLIEFLFDTTQTKQPTVYTKADPDVQVTATSPCRPGDWRSVHMKPMADRTTVYRGADLSFTFNFQINGGIVLSAPPVN